MGTSQLPQEKEEIACQLCGSKECKNAFVYCVNCVKYAIHWYCLPVLPKTLTEFVYWYCEDCEETFGKSYPSKRSSPLREKAKKLKKSRSKNKRTSVRLVNVANEELISESSTSKASADVAKVNPDSQMVSEDSYLQAEPVLDPIWSGSFNIEIDGYGLCDGLVAHMSSKASKMACLEAELFSKSIYMELLPKTSVWPKSFLKSEPSGDNIALYFFASNESCMKVFDGLVSEMMSKELALKAMITNAELLVFTSNELPISYRKFEGKFYLWGVFREKQAPLFDSTNCQLTIQNVGNGEYNFTNNKELDARSPISSLSNISNSGLRWTAPDAGEIKLNVDAIVSTDTKQGAIGGIIRDNNGVWVHGYYMYLGNSHIETAQLFAIFKGLQAAWELGIRKLTLESNSEEAIEAVNNASSDHRVYHYIEIIRMLMERDWICQINWVSQEANTCACRLTQEAFSTLSADEMAEPPKFMSTFLVSDKYCGVV